ncbi:MarR family winged helix-turn-helix transcriptional regulator [Caulobacter sp. 17J80-11]|uniref:MarR family winged helix-turn-helix transcriptional regulator n=1 Tax=Caulobacter sp. 17J80-11 TaxID=2763502 RepID=UPI001653B6D6|nr:MarR family transcriptional regulator [Caulobacter sp. 17J80-11]MBC6980187.1 MarR family transcriptional regulator [Caulobacter sp. 17J80-11]
MQPAEALKLDRQLCFPLYAASNAVTKAYRPYLAPLGLTYPQYLVMLVLWEGDGASLGQIGRRLKLDSGTLTPLVKRLEAAGLVKRTRSPGDERVLVVELTEAGRDLRVRAEAVPLQLAARLDMSPAVFERLKADLEGLIAQLG